MKMDGWMDGWISNVAKKYKDIISKSTLIHSGSPALYQLRPKEEKIGTLTRKTVGEKNLDKVNKTILLVGETGAGKSTLINALVNYAMGVKFEDNIWFEIVENEQRSQTESQTSDVVVYEVFGFEGQTLPFSLTIIYTPGFGDTRGMEQDAIDSDRLLDLFRSEEGVHELSAVGLVMKASDNRLNDRLKYIFDSVMSLFGNDMENNIIALMTHSDGITPENALGALDAAGIKCARDEENQPVHFLFNNQQTTQRTEMTQRSERALKSAWETTQDEMGEFTEFLEAATPQKLKTTVEVLNSRIRPMACVQVSNISTKYKDIISKSTLIHPGSPALYQLRPKEEKIGTLTRKTVGEKNLDKVNKTILLVGETGAGKSTLINALVNYAMGVTFEDNIWFEIVENEQRSQTESQTSDVVVYEVFGFEGQTLPFSLTIIYTPGFGDTRGMEQDAIDSDRLLDLFRSEEGVHELSAVGLVMKASDNRLNDRLKYIFDSVMSLFGNDMENNIIALMTHSDGITPENALGALDAAGIKCARDEENQPVHFLFNNQQTTQRTEMTQRSERALKSAWETTQDEMGEFTEFLEAATPQKLKTTVEVLNSRIRPMACVQVSNISTKYKDIISKSTLIHPGSPALYQLRPKEEKIGTLTRKTVGEKNLDKVNKTILLVGETGAGKSTLINALVNYAMGVTFEDNIWFEIVENEQRSHTESQASDVIVYEVFGFEDQTLPFSLTIIYTPGFGDTRGMELDAIVSDRLLDLFRSEEGVHELSAVGLVMKASDNRLNDRLKYIFDSVMSLFGNDMENNIIALMTHSDGITPENALGALDAAGIKCARDEENQPVHFLFNNQQTTQRTEMTQRSERALKSAWETTQDEMGEFTEFLEAATPQKLKTTVEVLNSRIRPMTCVQVSNISTKYKDIISKSTLIHPGSPALYQLRPKEEKIGTLTRKTVGEKNLDKVNKTILLVGETGAGKSTLINALVNYAMGVTFEDNIWFEIVENEQRSHTESQASDVIVYEVFGFEDQTLPFSLTIIYTPGFGDTRGMELDAIVSDRLLDLFRSEEGVHELSAVGLVMKASDNRLNDRLKYIFDSVMSLFGNDMENNIIALMTHSDGITPENALGALDAAGIKCARDEENQPVHFLFNNQQTTQRTEMTQRSERALKSAWETTQDEMGEFTEFLEAATPQKLKTTVEVLNSRIRPMTCIQVSNISTKYKDIISKSTLIHPGSPALYQLRPKEEKIGTLTRKTVGEKNLDKVNKTILLVGETGAGKSTLINALVNYAMGVTFEDNIWFEIVENEQRSQTESQTSDVVVYEVFGFEDQTLPFSLTIIYTPGFGHTRGMEQDAIDSDRLLDLFRSEEGVHELSAVGLVMKASDNRLNDRLKYIFDSVMSLFGNNMENNIIALMTHSDGITPENALGALDAAGIKCARDEENQPVHFLFNNQQTTQRTEMTQRSERALKSAWETTQDEMGEFTEFLEAATPQKLKTTVEVLNSRIRPMTCVQVSNISTKYKDIISKSTLIHPGSPALYQLRPKEEKIGTLTRKTVGEKNLDKVNKTILLVGETGAGKSTLINALVNYAMGVTFEDNIWFEIVENEQRSHTESQASDVIVYEVFGFEDQTLPFSLTIIYTPGFGDTRGMELDAIVSDRLLDLFRSEEGVHELSAVGLVMKASDNRLNDRLKYIFDSVMSLFGNNMENNIIALMTHSDGITPENALGALDAAGIKCARDEENQPVHFLFNNQQTTQRTEMTQRSERALKSAWETTQDEMGEFTEFLEAATPQKLKTTVEVLNSRIRPMACVQVSNISTKYKDIISKSTLIHPGSPALYQLRPKEEKIGTLTRKTVGEKNLDKVNKTILLVGETGAGKSTLINALVNYAMGVTFEDNIWFEIVENEQRSHTESQASDVIVYEVFGFEDQTLPFSLTIIYTPGFGDTRGMELDAIVSDRLLDLFRSEEGVHELSAVGLVMKASDNRLNDRLKYIFDSVMSLFGNNMENNIIALMTHSDGITPENALGALDAAGIKCARDEENQPVHFLFNNQQTTQTTEMTQRSERALKSAWETTQDEMGEFTEFLEAATPQKLKTTVEVLNSRIRPMACVQVSNISTKYKDIISKSTLIHPGSPALYQLRPKEEKIGTLTRKTVGEKNLDKVNKTILLVGETGAGKSTLINALVNYAMGVTFEDNIWFEIVENEQRSQTESQTSDVVVYEVFGFEDQTLPFSLTIIYTPGFGHTRGMELDAIVSDRLLDLFRSEEGVHELSAVGLVMKASDNRLNDRLKYIFDSVMSLFGNNMENNIIALMTHSDGITPENALGALDAAGIKCARDEENQPVHFLFNNQQTTQRTEMTQRSERALKSAWETTQDEMGEFTEFLEAATPQKLKTTVEVLNSRIRPMACVQVSNISTKYKDIISKSTLIHPGSPALYQLRPKEEKIGTLTRKTVGEKNLDKVNKTILLVGETGAGKSTLINALVNYAMGVTFEDNIWFEIVENEQRSQTESQTSDVVVYEVFGFEDQTLPFSLTIIYTPGFGHTRGMELDAIVSDRLLDLFRSEEGVHELSAVGLVMKASDNRLNDRLKYIFDSVMSLFGNDMENNIIALMTHSDGITPENALGALDAAGIKCARDEENQPVHFLFNNQQTTQRTEMTQRSERALKSAWETTQDEMGEFTEFLEAATPQKLKTTVEVLNSHIRPMACVQVSNISTKYKDIISKSTLIHPGSPALYQLRPKEEKIGTLTRKTVGEKNLDKVNKTILLVGETGAGKSTLINALVNYAMGVTFEDNIWFEIVENEQRSHTESQASDVIVYEVFGFEDQTLPFSLTIIYTPGFGDTRGMELDAIVSDRLLDLFRSEGVHELSAVGLVMKASDNRLNDRLKYIFDSVMSLFGNDMENNIIALMTHSDGITPENAFQALDAAGIKCARDEKNQPVHFLFNNQQTKQRTEMTKREERALKNAWETTQDEMGEFTEFLEAGTPQKVKTTVEVLNSRIRLTACIQNLKERIQLIELKQTEIRQIEEAQKKCDLKNIKFKVEVDEPYKVKEKIPGGWRWFGGYNGAVTCNICKENCHYPGCTVAVRASHCEVMVGGSCTSCTRKCPASDHVKETWRYVTKTRKVMRVDPAHLKNLEKEMKELMAEKTQCLEEAYRHVVRLDQIALNVKSVSTYVHLDFLIEKMKEKGDTKIQKLEKMKSRMDEATSAGVRSMYEKLTTAGKTVKEMMKDLNVSK